MKKPGYKFLTFLFACLFACVAWAETYIECLATGTFPQGGAKVTRSAGATLTIGSYMTELTAVEGSIGVQDRSVSLGTDFLVHAAAWSLYDRFFGYSAFDPFAVVGVNGWVGDGRGIFGPVFGFGAFYHLTDHLAIRAQTNVTLGIDRCVEPVYAVAAGFHYTF